LENENAPQPQPWSEVVCPHCNGSGLAEDAPQPQREWVGLTYEERREICDKFENDNGQINAGISYARAIEAKLKEKNYGLR
jgi:hypothetical protein